MNKIAYGFLAAVLAVWIALHLFLNWAMPAFAEPVADAVPASPEFNAVTMMRADTCKYGPLQYRILDLLSPAVLKKSIPDDEAYLAAISKRIVVFRTASAGMQFGTAVFIFLFALLILELAPVWSAFAAVLFLLVPSSLFYSLTTNMDGPYVFWFTGAVFFAFLAEKYSAQRTRYTFFHLLAGFFLAASFCTKDQVYAACLLPAALFAVWKFRSAKERRAFSVVLPFLLWGGAFLAGTCLIYAVTGGWEIFVEHFRWITGSGQQGFQQTDGSISGRIRLIGYSVMEFIRMFDVPLLALSAALAALLALKRENFSPQVLALLVFLFSALLSFHLFFTQIVRFNHARYMLLFLPFAVMLIAFAASKTDRRLTGILAGIVLAAQVWTAAQLLYSMNHLPMTEICRAYAEHPEWKRVRTATVTATEGFYYNPGKEPSSIHTIRHWSAAYIIPNAFQTDIFPSEPYFAYLNPRFILLSEKQKDTPEIQAIMKSGGYVLAADFQPVSIRGWTFFDSFQPESMHLYYLSPGMPSISQFPLFAKFSFDRQLMQMTDFLKETPKIVFSELIPLGRALAKYQTPDVVNYNISPQSLVLALAAYHSAGRKDDADAVRKFILSAVPGGEEILRSLTLPDPPAHP